MFVVVVELLGQLGGDVCPSNGRSTLQILKGPNTLLNANQNSAVSRAGPLLGHSKSYFSIDARALVSTIHVPHA